MSAFSETITFPKGTDKATMLDFTKKYREEQARVSQNNLNEMEARLNDDLKKKSWEQFSMENPDTLFTSKEDFESYQYDFRRPLPENFFVAYGPKEGARRSLNYTGVAPAWLGADQDIVRELDINTLEWDEQEQAFKAQVRVADKKNNRSYTGPITRAGDFVRDLFKMGGKEKVEEEIATRHLDVDTINKMYDGVKTSLSNILGGGDVKYLQDPELQNLTFFDPSGPERQKRTDYLLNAAQGISTSLAGQEEETPSPTDTEQQTTEAVDSKTVVPTLKLSEDELNKIRTYGISGTPSRDKLPDNLKNYIQTKGTTPFGIPPEEFNSAAYSDKERQFFAAQSKRISDQNIKNEIRKTLDPFFGFFDDLSAASRGQSVEDSNTRKEMKRVYGSTSGSGGILNDKILKDAFEINPDFFTEFKTDPVAFANKYKNNINALKGTPPPPELKNKIVKGSQFKISDADKNALDKAIKDNNLSEFTSILDKLTASGEVPDALQEDIVKFMGEVNNFSRTSKNRDVNYAIALNMYKVMTPAQRTDFGPALRNFAEFGLFSFKGIDTELALRQEERLSQANRSGGSKINVVQGFFDIVQKMRAPDFDIQKEIELGSDIRFLSNQVETANEARAFADALGLYANKWFKANGEPTWVTRFLSIGQAKGGATEALSLSPNVVVYDSQYNVITPESYEAGAKPTYFKQRDPGGAGTRGEFVPIGPLLEGPGGALLGTVLESHFLNLKFNPSAGG